MSSRQTSLRSFFTSDRPSNPAVRERASAPPATRLSEATDLFQRTGNTAENTVDATGIDTAETRRDHTIEDTSTVAVDRELRGDRAITAEIQRDPPRDRRESIVISEDEARSIVIEG